MVCILSYIKIDVFLLDMYLTEVPSGFGPVQRTLHSNQTLGLSIAGNPRKLQPANSWDMRSLTDELVKKDLA